MLEDLREIVWSARALLARLDVDALTGPEARTAVEAFAELERVAGAGKTLAVGRLDHTGAWIGDGSFRDLPAWLASVSGTAIGESRSITDTARRLRDLPTTAGALRAGDLSSAQASVISAAATADASAEDALLAQAPVCGMKGLRAECDRVVAAAQSAEEQQARAERIHRARTLRHHRGEHGTGRIVIEGPLDRTAQVMAALEPYERDLFEQFRRARDPEHPDTIAFDAMLRLVEHRAAGRDEPATDRRKGSRPLGVVVLHISLDAYLRGHLVPGELCEVEGAGPVPVGAAHRLAADAVLRAVVTDGTDVTRVSHLGRTIPAHLRTAIETRDRVCVIEGCDVDRHLEIDHNEPVAALGVTSLANLGSVCHHHHDLKTRRDLRRVGPPGHQRLVSKEEHAALTSEAERGPP
ncbi:MAG: DUF222 domain-containing protein [Acidimicrobiia bacterium]